MERFDFRRTGIEIDIAGTVYKIEPTAELTQMVLKYQDKWLETFSEQNKDNARDDIVIGECANIIDDILGLGEFETIFTGREINVTDCCDLVVFILGNITSYYGK